VVGGSDHETVGRATAIFILIDVVHSYCLILKFAHVLGFRRIRHSTF